MNKPGSHLAFFLTAVTLLTSVSVAANEGVWYGRVNAGFSSLGDSDISLADQSSASTEFDSGLLIGGAIGRQIGAFRVEGEIAFRSNDISTNDLAGYRGGDDSGDFASLGLGLNLLYEKNLFGSDRAVSYFGGGVVYIQEIDMDLVTLSGDEVSFSDSDFGIQLLAGARYEVTPDWDLFAELRYFDGGSVTLDSESDSDLSVKADYDSAALVFGAGYRF